MTPCAIEHGSASSTYARGGALQLFCPAQMWTEFISSRHESLADLIFHSQVMSVHICHTHAPDLLASFHGFLSRVLHAADCQLLDLIIKSFSKAQKSLFSAWLWDYTPQKEAPGRQLHS